MHQESWEVLGKQGATYNHDPESSIDNMSAGPSFWYSGPWLCFLLTYSTGMMIAMESEAFITKTVIQKYYLN